MTDIDVIKNHITMSKRAAAEDMKEIHAQQHLTREFFGQKLRDFVLHKYMLDPGEEIPDDFNKLTDLSLSRSMKISPELVKEFDLARSCDGASSAMAKKVLLFMAIQRELDILLPARESARIKDLSDLADLAWEEMCASPSWQEKVETGKEA